MPNFPKLLVLGSDFSISNKQNLETIGNFLIFFSLEIKRCFTPDFHRIYMKSTAKHQIFTPDIRYIDIRYIYDPEYDKYDKIWAITSFTRRRICDSKKSNKDNLQHFTSRSDCPCLEASGSFRYSYSWLSFILVFQPIIDWNRWD